MAVEPIITNEKEYEEYQRKQMEEEAEAIANPKATTQYESPIGPEREPSFRKKIESKARDISEGIKAAPGKAYEGIKTGVGNIKKNYEENVEYERKRARVEREVKSSPEYIKRQAEHELYMEEVRARKSASAPRRGSTKAVSSIVSVGTYKPAYSGRSTMPGIGFGGGYQPAYRGQTMAAAKPVKSHVQKLKTAPIHITSFGSGAMPKIGNFGGISTLPKIGGHDKKIETPKIGGFSFGTIPKIGGSITHKGSVKSIGLNTNIGKLGEIPKIEFGMKKAPVKSKRKTKRRSKKR